MWLFNSSIGRKFVMSITGMALVLFLLFHASMNFVLILSESGYNWICEMLGANWYALVGTMGLAALVLIHFCYALWLTFQNRAARGTSRYEETAKVWGVDWNSKNMLALGFVVLGFLCLHLYNFWFKMQFAELTGLHTGAFDPQNGAAYVKYLFSGVVTADNFDSSMLTMPSWSHPVYCALYLVWLAAIWFHLTHGIWSALHTMGFNNLIWFNRIKVISCVFASLIVLLFAAVPVYYLAVFCGIHC
ncbi:MAG: succinate dehydrogenase/fumarate reductase cytochrome b subunit [Paludibacteraceae bacterium]|nr:succinate dehydrogenase/fumarate reductase cytochrome b subunit [Paludibacteraceae bacterium]